MSSPDGTPEPNAHDTLSKINQIVSEGLAEIRKAMRDPNAEPEGVHAALKRAFDSSVGSYGSVDRAAHDVDRARIAVKVAEHERFERLIDAVRANSPTPSGAGAGRPDVPAAIENPATSAGSAAIPDTTASKQPETPPPATSGSDALLADGVRLSDTQTSAKKYDGPTGGRWVWWGDRHDVPAGVVYRLIDHMWDRESSGYDAMIGGEGGVFEDAVAPQTIRARVSDVNRELHQIGVPWKLSADSVARTICKLPR